MPTTSLMATAERTDASTARPLDLRHLPPGALTRRAMRIQADDGGVGCGRCVAEDRHDQRDLPEGAPHGFEPEG